MREIKFRGLSSTGEWVYGWVVPDLPRSTNYYDGYSQRIVWYPESGGVSSIPVKNGTVCQYTNVKDIIGNEIYEGDIVKTVADLVYVVRYAGSAYKAGLNNLHSTHGHLGVEVIGDIFHNPEFIEVDGVI